MKRTKEFTTDPQKINDILSYMEEHHYLSDFDISFVFSVPLRQIQSLRVRIRAKTKQQEPRKRQSMIDEERILKNGLERVMSILRPQFDRLMHVCHNKLGEHRLPKSLSTNAGSFSMLIKKERLRRRQFKKYLIKG